MRVPLRQFVVEQAKELTGSSADLATGRGSFEDVVNVAAAATLPIGGEGAVFKEGVVTYRQYTVGKGGVLEVMANTSINGKALTLSDIMVYPRGAERLSLGAREIIQARDALAAQARAAGFATLRITGVRHTGAAVGKKIDIILDLVRAKK